jgi:hypothetical protein
MSQVFFDEVLAAAPRDESLDNGWVEIKKRTGMRSWTKADMGTILEEMQTMYWKGVKREVASLIVALADFDEFQPEALPIEILAKEELLSSKKLESLIDLWDPLDQGVWPKDSHAQKPDLIVVRQKVEEAVTAVFDKESPRKRRARALLQALGLLDIDVVREHRPPPFRSWGQRPQVDDFRRPLLVARQCSECRHCIRSFHYPLLRGRGRMQRR